MVRSIRTRFLKFITFVKIDIFSNSNVLNKKADKDEREYLFQIKSCVETWDNKSDIFKKIYGGLFTFLFYIFPAFIIVSNYSKKAGEFNISVIQKHFSNGSSTIIASKAYEAASNNSSQNYKESKLIQTVRKTIDYQRAMFRQKKTTKAFLFMSMFFIISWSPLHLLNLIFYINEQLYESQVLHTVYYYFLWFGHVNSVLNPLFYTLFCKKFKTIIKQKAKK